MTMATTQVHRTRATDTLTVSTILVREGKARFYETTIVVAPHHLEGMNRSVVLEPVRAARKYEAGLMHDDAVAWARGYRDAQNKRHDHWANALKNLEGKLS